MFTVSIVILIFCEWVLFSHTIFLPQVPVGIGQSPNSYISVEGYSLFTTYPGLHFLSLVLEVKKVANCRVLFYRIWPYYNSNYYVHCLYECNIRINLLS